MKKIVITLAIVLLSSIFAGTVFAVTGIVNTDEVNLRDGASKTGTNILTKIRKNSELEIVGEEGDWYNVNYSTYSGYVNKQYVDKKEENIVNTIADGGNTDSINSSEPKAKEDAIVYVLPLINSSKISEVKKDENVMIISEIGNWKYIQTSYISGWVLANKINGSLKDKTSEISQEGNQNNETNIIDTNTTNDIENTNNTDNTNINNETVENTTINEVAISQNTADENNTVDEGNASETYPMTLYVNVEDVNIRESPNTSSEINDSAEKNDAIKVTGESGDWYKVEVNGVKGYIMKKYLSKTKV